MGFESFLCAFGGCGEFTTGGVQHAPAACADGQKPVPSQPFSIVMKTVDQRIGLLHPAQFDEHLGRIGDKGRGDDLGRIRHRVEHRQRGIVDCRCRVMVVQ